MVWRVCALAAWAAAMVGLVLLDPDNATYYVLVGAPLTVGVGALVDRWWALVAPIVVTAVAVLVLRATCISGCGDWSGPEGAGWYSIFFALPAMVLLAVGIGLRRITRRVDSGGAAAFPPAPLGSRPPGPGAP